MSENILVYSCIPEHSKKNNGHMLCYIYIC